jgi:hypothetical protein
MTDTEKEYAKTHCTVCGALQPEDAPTTLLKDTVVYYCRGLHGRICKPPSPCATFVKCREARCPDGVWVCNKPECLEGYLKEAGWKCHRCQKIYYCCHPLTGIQWRMCTGPVDTLGKGGDGCCNKKICPDCSFKSGKYTFHFCAEHAFREKEIAEHSGCKAGFHCMDEDCPYW